MPMTTDHLRASGFTDYTSNKIDNLFGGDSESWAEKETLVSGQTLLRGAVLGRITTGGKMTLALSASSDGSQTPVAVLAEDCDASGGDKECMVYKAGCFNESALTLGTGITLDKATRHALRGLDIYIRKNVAAT